MKNNAGTKGVVMPPRAPYEALRHMAGQPLILAASDEASLRKVYKAVRLALIH